MKIIQQIIKKHFDSIDSTNNYAALQSSNLDEGMLLLTTADEQTSGRGRFGHHWFSPRKLNFYGTFSFLFERERKDSGNLPQVLALSAESVLRNLGVSIRLKWPNDLLVNEKKIGGILTEAKVIDDSKFLCMLIGIGININMSSEQAKCLDRPCTSLLIETGKTHAIEVFREKLLQTFVKDLNLFFKEGFPPFLDLYKAKLCHRQGDVIRFHTQGKMLEGTFLEMNDTGLLKLILPGGIISEFASGEIF